MSNLQAKKNALFSAKPAGAAAGFGKSHQVRSGPCGDTARQCHGRQ